MTTGTDNVLDHLRVHQYTYIIIALLVLFNVPLFGDLIHDWAHDGNYSHGFLVIPLSAYLFYRRRKELRFPASPSKWGLPLFALGCFGLVLGAAASEFFTSRVALVMTVTGAAWCFLGAANFRKVWFAFFFLLFMIPLPSTIYYSATLPMQLFASRVTDIILRFIGVPSQRLGNIIHLPSYTLEVSEACSGIRSLATLLALSALYGHLALPGKLRPVILFLSAIPVAIIINIVRLLFAAIGTYAVSPRLADSLLHPLSGVLVFLVAIILIAVEGALLKWQRNPS